MNMTERVARALHASVPDTPWDGISWDDLPENDARDNLRRQAKAAIEAMRDPPDEMLLAPGKPYDGKIEADAGLAARRAAWNKMIAYAVDGHSGNPMDSDGWQWVKIPRWKRWLWKAEALWHRLCGREIGQ